MQRLQRIRTGRVSNASGFGRALARLCRSDAMLEPMPDHGFMDGGCLSLALAIRMWLGEDVVGIRFAGRPGRLDHAVAEIAIGGRAYILDADGLGTWDDVREKLRILESCPDALPVDADLATAAEYGITDDGRHHALAAVLSAHFGRLAPCPTWLEAEEPGIEAAHRPSP
jgi:hypothetical protein